MNTWIKPASELPKTADVVVIGGGVNGASIAFQLAKRGAGKVVLLERRHIGAGATGKSGALVRAHYSNVPESTLAHESLNIFRNWEEEVGFGAPRFEEVGFFRIVNADDGDKLRANVASHQAIGVNVELVDGKQAAEIEPLMFTDDIAVAAYEPGSGYADPNATTYGYIEGAIRFGAVVCTETEATSILTDGARVTGVQTNRGSISAPNVVLAGGAWADRLLTPIGIDLPIEPHRVQVTVFRWPIDMNQSRKHAVVIDSTDHAWLRPEGIAGTLIGLEHKPGRIDPDNLDESVESSYIDKCRATLVKRFPVFAGSTMRGCWSGVVMQSQDSHPIIDKPGDYDGLYLMSGDSGTSFKTAPATGICMAQWVIDGAPSLLDLTPFRASRFAEGKPWIDELAYNQELEVTISR